MGPTGKRIFLLTSSLSSFARFELSPPLRSRLSFFTFSFRLSPLNLKSSCLSCFPVIPERLFATHRQAHFPAHELALFVRSVRTLSSPSFSSLLFHFLLSPFSFKLEKQLFKLLPCDPGETRTLNQQNRNLPFYPLNYGTNNPVKVKPIARFYN